MKTSRLLITAAVTALLLTGCGSEGNGGPYRAALADGQPLTAPAGGWTPGGSVTVVNPSDLRVTFTVTNTGSQTGTPTCTLNATDPSGHYSGWDSAALKKPLQPGKSRSGQIDLAIDSDGARHVTELTIDCT
ncbi:hypothetical protein [Sphaerimonospora thailandensis]|uniref:Uncharacterized protein n=1 Tax=Sphaerimonospora thailandensis TaxID=795644 RepID=A0A8J3VYW4_9ACTN|nr:hypothetical protein [Sphaerimonospora thailandensis]GIH69410.1 hypothetical protein Mth01_16630 [Sphaerimonospora thailandensis]